MWHSDFHARHDGKGLWIGMAALAAIAIVGTAATLLFRSDGEQKPAASVPSAPLSAPRSVAPSTVLSIGSNYDRLLPGSSPRGSTLIGGETNHLAFADEVAQALFAYDPSTDFQARNADLLRAAAPTPWGDPESLAQDLTKYTPAGPALDSIRNQGTTVTVSLTDVAVSLWASKKLAAIGASSGTYGIDITGTQTIATSSGAPVTVPVQLGITVACPPATQSCTLDRVFPQHLQDALGSR